MVLRRHVTEGSLWLGRRQCRHDAGSKIDFKNLCESCPLRSVKLNMYAPYRVFIYGMPFVKLVSECVGFNVPLDK